jgi:uncharacterized protein YjbJ (UPF0337 family)
LALLCAAAPDELNLCPLGQQSGVGCTPSREISRLPKARPKRSFGSNFAAEKLSRLSEVFPPLRQTQIHEETLMNSDEMRGKWNQLKGSVKQQWGKLTDDDLTTIDGQRDKLVGKIQERYGIAREEAERQLNQWKMPQHEEVTHEEVTRRKVS